MNTLVEILKFRMLQIKHSLVCLRAKVKIILRKIVLKIIRLNMTGMFYCYFRKNRCINLIKIKKVDFLRKSTFLMS